jgi:hypothetical protein
MLRPRKKWLLIPVVYLIASSTLGNYLANRGKFRQAG